MSAANAILPAGPQDGSTPGLLTPSLGENGDTAPLNRTNGVSSSNSPNVAVRIHLDTAKKPWTQFSPAADTLIQEQLQTTRVLVFDESEEADAKLPWLLKKEPLTGGYKYLVLLGAVLCLFVFSSTLSMSLLIVPLEEYFNLPRSSVTVFLSVELGVFCVTTIFMGRFIDRVGMSRAFIIGTISLVLAFCVSSRMPSYWPIVPIYGVLGGIGASCLQLLGMLIVQDWFEPQGAVGLALGAALSGVGVGNVGFTYYIQYFIDTYGWRAAFLYTGLFCLAVSIIGIILSRARCITGYEMSQIVTTVGERAPSSFSPPIFPYHLLVRPRFAILLLAVFITTFLFYAPFVHLVPSAEHHGMSSGDAAFLIVIMGINTLVFRWVFGFMADLIGGLGVLLVSWVMQLSAMVIWYYATTPGIYYFLAVWVGISGAAHIVGLSHAPKQMAAANEVPDATAMIFGLSFAVGACTIGPIMGRVYDDTNSYDGSLMVLAIVEALPVLILCYLIWYHPENNKPKPVTGELIELYERVKKDEDVHRSGSNRGSASSNSNPNGGGNDDASHTTGRRSAKVSPVAPQDAGVAASQSDEAKRDEQVIATGAVVTATTPTTTTTTAPTSNSLPISSVDGNGSGNKDSNSNIMSPARVQMLRTSSLRLIDSANARTLANKNNNNNKENNKEIVEGNRSPRNGDDEDHSSDEEKGNTSGSNTTTGNKLGPNYMSRDTFIRNVKIIAAVDAALQNLDPSNIGLSPEDEEEIAKLNVSGFASPSPNNI